MDFYADLDQLAYQYERLADEEKAKPGVKGGAAPLYCLPTVLKVSDK